MPAKPEEKIEVARIDPASLREVSLRELLSIHHRLHQLWGANFEGKSNEKADR